MVQSTQEQVKEEEKGAVDSQRETSLCMRVGAGCEEQGGKTLRRPL